jgi:hypothetical protein
MDRDGIIREILSIMQKHGGPSYSWYVGISQDAKEALFSNHKVSIERGIWIWKPADNPKVAREVEDYFVDNFYSDGALFGRDILSTQVYAYKKASDTKP